MWFANLMCTSLSGDVSRDTCEFSLIWFLPLQITIQYRHALMIIYHDKKKVKVKRKHFFLKIAEYIYVFIYLVLA